MRQPGRTDLEQKASVVSAQKTVNKRFLKRSPTHASKTSRDYAQATACDTGVVRRWNDGSKKNSEWKEEKRKLFNLGKGMFAQKPVEALSNHSAPLIFLFFLAVMPKCDSPFSKNYSLKWNTNFDITASRSTVFASVWSVASTPER